MSDDLSNNAAPLRKNAVGTPADGQKMRSDATGTSYTVPSIVTVSVKPVDSKTLEGSYPGDHRAIGAQPNPLAETTRQCVVRRDRRARNVHSSINRTHRCEGRVYSLPNKSADAQAENDGKLGAQSIGQKRHGIRPSDRPQHSRLGCEECA